MKRNPKGRAKIITMTRTDRDGWQADIKKIHQLFLYLGVHTDYLFDLKGKVRTLYIKIFHLPLNISECCICMKINSLISGVNPEFKRFCI